MTLRNIASPAGATLPDSPTRPVAHRPEQRYQTSASPRPEEGYETNGGPRLAPSAHGGLPNSPLRSGFTLIEILVVISVGSSVMLTAIALAHTAFTLQSQAQMRFERSFTLNRFIEGFRSDVHLANRFEVTSEQSLTLFLADDQRVEYRGQADRLTRRQAAAEEDETDVGIAIAEESDITDEIAHPEIAHLEQVQLAPGSTVRFSRDAESGCVVLEVVDAASDASAATTTPPAAASTANQPRRSTRQIIVSPGQIDLQPAAEKQAAEKQASDDSQEQP